MIWHFLVVFTIVLALVDALRGDSQERRLRQLEETQDTLTWFTIGPGGNPSKDDQ